MPITTLSAPYDHLVERINRFPQGAPPSENLYAILKILFSPQEAELVSQLPIRPFTAQQAAKIWKTDLTSARKVLDGLASRAILIDIEYGEEVKYVLPPPMAGFFEFSMMRMRDDVDQQVLGELFYQYCTVEEDFIRGLFTRGETQLGRVFVNEPVLPDVHVLDYERASEVIRTASHRGIGICYCRYKMEKVGRSCSAPQDICMTFNTVASSLIRHNFAREVDVAEGLDLLQQAYDNNLVQFGENAQHGVNFICNCCGCCCEAMIAARRFGLMHPVHTTNFLPQVSAQECTGCGKCVNVCPVEAMGLVSSHEAHLPNHKKARVDENICLGCGVCARVCPQHGIQLHQRPERVITPLNSTHKVVMMAIERGNLQELIFDNQVMASQRAMATLLGVILRLPPLKQTLAMQQVKSHYLGVLIEKFSR